MQTCSATRWPIRIASATALLGAAATAAAQSLIYTLPGAAGDRLGSEVAFVGDIDGDGVADFASNAWAGGDRVNVYSGASPSLLYTLTSGVDDDFGRSIAALGDLDGDAIGDFAVGADNSAKVFSGASGVQLQSYAYAGALDVGGGGDATGDGIGDVLIGANGQLFVHDGLTGALVRSHNSPPGVCAFGNAPTFYGDVNGDGLAEYAVGAPGFLFCGNESRVFAYDGASGNLLWSDVGTYNDELGWALAAFDDVNGDGAPELLASAKQDPGIGCGPCNGRGYVRLLDGATGAVLWQVDGAGSYTGLGFDLARLADFDGDGISDLAASQPGSLFGCDSFGLPVQVRSGASGALLFEIPWGGEGFGYALAGGDANGDGWQDLLVGVSCDSTFATFAGFLQAFTIEEPVASYCTAKQNSQGCLPAMSWTGTASLALSTFRANAAQVINQQFGILIWGRTQAAIPFQGGTLCIGGTIVRTGAQQSAGNPPPDDCSGAFAYQFTSSYLAAQAIGAGELIDCQYWYRDPMSTPPSGLSDALEFLVLP